MDWIGSRAIALVAHLPGQLSLFPRTLAERHALTRATLAKLLQVARGGEVPHMSALASLAHLRHGPRMPFRTELLHRRLVLRHADAARAAQTSTAVGRIAARELARIERALAYLLRRAVREERRRWPLLADRGGRP
jgi:hypothetical protein